MTKPDYSIFDENDETRAVEAIRWSLNPQDVVDRNKYVPISVAAAVFVMDTIHGSSSKHLDPTSVMLAADEPVVSDVKTASDDMPVPHHEDRSELYRRELLALDYVGEESTDKIVILREKQIDQIYAMRGVIGNFHDRIRQIEDAEAHDAQTMQIYKLLDEAFIAVRKASVEWLEEYQKDYWRNTITHACRDVSDTQFAAFSPLNVSMMESKGWRQFRSGVDILYDECLQITTTRR